ncbi:flagellar basal body rod protein FlgB [Marinomonas sp. 15G1-11]|uniref:Flagellar basal body rod protein FlgB n=1 Tax=Marinomonas phaeophyticola TaxID=3004091 RepID=A0ABT4JS56_9GAMM|nr:flagellar basal body rod protein FlgB [Marinomonas sp. 15G1-11]MCZ2721190.1 flagellar basal body rod protein FlgB [Marinomonas sp. 15G1-11]
MAITFEGAFAGHDKALLFRSARSAVLANNIANSDTPNYKARDISFESMMQEATRSQLSMSATNNKHFSQSSGFSGSDDDALLYRTPNQPSIDGNTVDMQREQAEFAQNSLQFDTSFLFLDRKISGMKKAISGGQ